MELTDREWKSFTVGELFSRIVSTRGKTTGQLAPGDDVPYIAAAKNNNGCAGVYSSKEHPEWVSKGNCIVFVQLGDGAAGIAHYVPMDFIGMSGKTSCGYIDGVLNCYNGVFIARALSINKELFSHGHSWTGRRLLNSRCMLPVTSDGKPDYAFMEQYIREEESKKREKYLAYVKERIAELGEVKDVGSLADREWKAFRIEDVFECTKGIYLPTEKVVDGNIPYITAKVGNNGLNKFIGNGILFHGNRITIEKIRLSAYYQPVGFYCSHDVSVIWNEHLNEYNAHFIATMIMRNSDKYSYGRQAQLNVVKREYILLPVTSDGTPDYEFMEQYSKNMMLKKYFQYEHFQEAGCGK